METIIDIPDHIEKEPIVDPPDDDDPMDPQMEEDVKANLLHLLEKKKLSMRISADCHAYQRDKYTTRTRVIGLFTVILSFASFVLSATGSSKLRPDGTMINVPLAVITGFATAVNSLKHLFKPAEKANTHDTNQKTATDIADDIEYVILKNNHTVKSLQQTLELYEDRIKSFRKSEGDIPLEVKQMFIPHILNAG